MKSGVQLNTNNLYLFFYCRLNAMKSGVQRRNLSPNETCICSLNAMKSGVQRDFALDVNAVFSPFECDEKRSAT